MGDSKKINAKKSNEGSLKNKVKPQVRNMVQKPAGNIRRSSLGDSSITTIPVSQIHKPSKPKGKK